ncbi:hypothetical protein [Wocania ichthyoenteri]|uniref:hypothetical protein n=2 Tax=Wocania TaxID=2834400 RepID=UPI00053E2844|nr:hypothetical protein [Wocania ichthyoenteri]
MKKLFLVLISFSFYFSCSKDNSIFIDNEIVGKWQVIEMVDDIIDPENEYDVLGLWTPIENGRFVELKSNGQFTNIYGCSSGNFRVENSKFFFSCKYENNDSVSEIQGSYDIDNEGVLTLSVGFVSERLKRVIIN